MQSIFDDFNNIDASFVTLVDTADTDYTARRDKREIEISFDGSTGGNSGEAQFQYEDGKFFTCTIKAESSLLDSAKDFVAIMTHELGHCLGLDHPQDTVHAIMSYFHDDEVVRLMMDDKMGIIFLYPKDKSAAKEDATLGLSCSRR